MMIYHILSLRKQAVHGGDLDGVIEHDAAGDDEREKMMVMKMSLVNPVRA